MRKLEANAQISNESFLMAAQEELLRLGAVNVNEVAEREWQALQSWGKLLLFEQRGFLQRCDSYVCFSGWLRDRAHGVVERGAGCKKIRFGATQQTS